MGASLPVVSLLAAHKLVSRPLTGDIFDVVQSFLGCTEVQTSKHLLSIISENRGCERFSCEVIGCVCAVASQ